MKRLLVLLILSAIACGGNDGKTGAFLGGTVKGLHYKSGKHSGLTDAQGYFTYDAGDTVTFSIGDIVLGSTKAAADVTPLDLFGATVPTSEAELAPKLRQAGVASPFTKAANVIYLLYALDIDGDSTNGIDLTGLDATLKGAHVSFSDGIYTFPGTDYAPLALRFGARDPAGIIIGAPLQYFYDVMKVAVSFHAVATRSFDNNNDGHPDDTDTYDYDASIGMRAHLHEDSDGDGVVDENETYSYDSSLRLLTDASVSPLGVGSDFTVTNAYSPQGDLASSERIVHASGAITEDDVTTRTYGTAGNITDLESSSTASGANSKGSTLTTYNDRGTVATIDQTDRVSNAITYHSLATNTYDASALLTKTVQVTTNTPAASTDGTITTTYVNNADGTLASREDDYDYGTDGSVDLKRLSSDMYGDDGRLARTTLEIYDGSGKLTSRTDEAYTYDGDGNILTDTRTRDTNGDGTVDTTSTNTYTYDADDNRLTTITATDTDGNGTVDSIVTATGVFDENSNQTSSRTDIDNGGDGTIDATSVTTTTYTAVAGDIRAAMNRYSLGQ